MAAKPSGNVCLAAAQADIRPESKWKASEGNAGVLGGSEGHEIQRWSWAVGESIEIVLHPVVTGASSILAPCSLEAIFIENHCLDHVHLDVVCSVGKERGKYGHQRDKCTVSWHDWCWNDKFHNQGFNARKAYFYQREGWDEKYTSALQWGLCSTQTLMEGNMVLAHLQDSYFQRMLKPISPFCDSHRRDKRLQRVTAQCVDCTCIYNLVEYINVSGIFLQKSKDVAGSKPETFQK